MVAAWISAETGVGPSIASGSQVCRPSWADLPIAPTNSSRQITVSVSKLAAETRSSVSANLRGVGEHGVELDRIEHEVDRGDAEREAEVADPVDEERLDRGGAGRGPGVPEADQQVGDQADALPAEEQLEEVVGGDQHQHEEGEQRQIAHEARDARVVRHVADRVDVDHRRDTVLTTNIITADSTSTRSAQSASKRAGMDPASAPRPCTARRATTPAQHDPGAERREDQAAAGHELRRRGRRSGGRTAPAITAPSSGRKTTASGEHADAQPRIRLMSSTSMLPRLRK